MTTLCKLTRFKHPQLLKVVTNPLQFVQRHCCSKKDSIVLFGQTYKSDNWTNVTPKILSLAEKKLHLDPKHPIGNVQFWFISLKFCTLDGVFYIYVWVVNFSYLFTYIWVVNFNCLFTFEVPISAIWLRFHCEFQLFIYIWVVNFSYLFTFELWTVCLHLSCEFQLFVYILIENNLLL